MRKKIPSKLLAATLVMSNKLIDKNRIQELWEEIKMLDVLEVAREKGIEEGRALGVVETQKETIREMLFEALAEKFGEIPPHCSAHIEKIQNQEALKLLFRQVFRCDNIQAFEEFMGNME